MESSGRDAPQPVQAGKYRVLAQLGQGGTSDVLLAVAHGPSGFSKLVVLKSMKGALRDEPDMPRMFMNEARLAARLNHPNIVQTNEVFEAGGLPTIVMEYLEGQTLSSITARAHGRAGGFPLPMRLRVISEALAGLHHSHELTDFDGTPLSVVHRDVSPHNVFVTFDGQVKLLDFGIAKLSGSHVETATGVMKGKLRYMAPEQIEGEGIDRRSDVYAVGVMLWEAATNTRIWHGLHDATVMNRVLNGEVPTPRSVNEHCDPALEAIAMKALSLAKDDRYPTAEALQKALDDYIEALDVRVRDREIGEAVAALFADERAETRQLIEARLATVATLSADEYASAAPLDLSRPVDAISVSRTRGSIERAPRERKQESLIWLALIAALAAFAIAGVSMWRDDARSAASVAQSAQAQARPSDAREAPRTVKLRVTAFPASAQISLDAERLPGNPFARSYPLEHGAQHTLLAHAPGHRDQQRAITLDQDLDVVLVLEPEAPPPPVLPSPARPPKPRANAATHSSADACDPPFAIDARGVKRFKPECL